MTSNKDISMKPILFSTPMVKALLNTKPGTYPVEPIAPNRPCKSQARRVIKPQPLTQRLAYRYDGLFNGDDGDGCHYIERLDDGQPTERYLNVGKARYQVGDKLWVRETHVLTNCGNPVYKADFRDKRGDYWASVESDPKGVKWRSPYHLHKEHARLFLEVREVRVERLQDITEADAKAEGVGKFFLDQWVMENEKRVDIAHWIYWEDGKRYWCERHIHQAVKKFKREVKEGTAYTSNLEYLRENPDEIGYMRGCEDEDDPIRCETCGKPLSFYFSSFPDYLDEMIEGCLAKEYAHTFASLLRDYETKLFERENIHRLLFSGLWNAINGKGAWESNPWVWVYGLMRAGK